MKIKIIVMSVVILAVVLIAPLTVAAATNTEIIAIMDTVITGVLAAGRDAYCAAGIATLCP